MDIGSNAGFQTLKGLLRRPECQRTSLLIGMFVQKRLETLVADFDFDIGFAFELGLTAESRSAAHVEGLVEDVELFVLDIRQRVEPLGHVDMACGARTHAATAVTLGSANLLGRLENGLAPFDLDFEILAYEANFRHQCFSEPRWGSIPRALLVSSSSCDAARPASA